MRTLLVSDLHLGRADGQDVLRRAEVLQALIDALRDVDRLVILGDGLELRESSHRDAVEIARPFFAAVGAALGADGELLVLAGNHDHGLAAGWIDARLQTEPAGFLGLEQRYTPRESGPLAERLAEAAEPARMELAYPGVWLRDDVYATHGHYADLHVTVPTFERLAAGAMARFAVRLPQDGARPDDYEAALAPLYAWMHVLAQRAGHGLVTAGAGASARTWSVLTARDRHRRPLRTLALGVGYAAAVAAINAVGIGPVERDLSPAALRRGYLAGFREAAQRLGIDARHLIWGHSHRSGPWPGDDEAEWTAAGGARILNAGSWVYQPHFLTTGDRSPYWPGTAIRLADDGPPRLVRLLDEETLRPGRA